MINNYFFNICENPGTLKVLYLFKNLLSVVIIVVPLIIVGRGIVTFIKPILSGEVNDIKGSSKELLHEIIVGLLIFIVPTAIPFIIDNFTGTNTLYETKQCMSHITLEEIQYYEKLFYTYQAVERMKASPNLSNIESTRKLVDEASGWAKEEHVVYFYTTIQEAETVVNESKLREDCSKKNGIYNNGYCLPGTSGNSTSSNTQSSTGSSTNVNGNDYYVIPTKTDLSTYSKYLKSNGVKQDANEAKWDNKCLSFSYTHAYGLYTNTTYTGEVAAAYTHQKYFSSYKDNNKQNVLKAVYNEIVAGKPCILQVNGDVEGTRRHFVTVVGFKKGVTSGDTIKETDLIIIDSWDADLEAMEGKGCRFMTNGAQTNSGYTGYLMYYLK